MKKFAALLSLLLFSVTGFAAAPVPVELSKQGKAAMPIVISEQAARETLDAATTLSQYLNRITGGTFEVQKGDGGSGIVVGTAADFPALTPSAKLAKADITQREDYALQSHSRGIYLIGATPKAVQHAVWDLLHRVGYRQFFPGPKWEIVPKTPALKIAVDTYEHPDYVTRRLSPGFGLWPENGPPYWQWAAANRVANGVDLRTGHVYKGIISDNQKEFDEHPEYRTKSNSTKFCVSNPGLQKLVVNWALNYLEKNPTADSVSMDPSDFGGWESESCPDGQIYKTITDRAVTLANIVAEAVDKKYPGKFVGMYAYAQHAPPPTIKVHPKVVVSVATALTTGGLSVDELMTGWSRQGATVGVREYYSVNQWDRDMPARPRVANLDVVSKNIARYHRNGARFMTAENSDNWGPAGLGYYVVSRLLWDVDEANNVDGIVNDFLDKSFGKARPPMEKFYDILSDGPRVLFSEDVIGRMYRLLDEAMRLSPDNATRARVGDLILYTHYLELYHRYTEAEGPARQDAFEKLIRYSYRIRRSGMVYSYALYRDLDRRDAGVAVPANGDFRTPEGTNPWKSSEPVTSADIATMLREGIANTRLLDFEPKNFSSDLVSAAPLKLALPPTATPSPTLGALDGSRNYYIWLDAPGPFEVRVRGGYLRTDSGDVHLELSRPEGEEPVSEGKAPPDKEEHVITLTAKQAGLHILQVRSSSGGATFALPSGMAFTVPATTDQPANAAIGRWSLYFYVPKRTKFIGGHAAGPGFIRDSAGKYVFGSMKGKAPGYFKIPVEPGQDGKLWQLDASIGRRILLTVPPYLALSPDKLLLPREVVEKDSQ